MVEYVGQLIHQENRLFEVAEETNHSTKCVLLVLFLNFQIFEHQTGKIDVFHPVIINLGEVVKAVRKIIVMANNQAQLYPSTPQEWIQV